MKDDGRQMTTAREIGRRTATGKVGQRRERWRRQRSGDDGRRTPDDNFMTSFFLGMGVMKPYAMTFGGDMVVCVCV